MGIPNAKYLNQVLSVEAGVRKKLETDKTALHRKSDKAALYDGHTQVYTPRDAEGDPQPSKNKVVQVRAEDVLTQLSTALVDLIDVVATKDVSNKKTSATVQIGDTVFLKDVPVPYLLFMEKQLGDIQKFVESMPTLDLSVEWKHNSDQRLFASEPVRTNSVKRDKVNHIKFAGDKNHPPQVEVFDNEVLVGFWDTIRYSGAFSDKRKQTILDRIMQFKSAVKFAREEANKIEVTNVRVGRDIMNFLFAD